MGWATAAVTGATLGDSGGLPATLTPAAGSMAPPAAPAARGVEVPSEGPGLTEGGGSGIGELPDRDRFLLEAAILSAICDVA